MLGRGFRTLNTLSLKPSAQASSQGLLTQLVPHQVAMIGSGAWACAAARMVAQNTAENAYGIFRPKVKMWVYEEEIEVSSERCMRVCVCVCVCVHMTGCIKSILLPLLIILLLPIVTCAQGKKLTEVINETHTNPRYLPGVLLPENIVAVPDLLEAAKDADILIFCAPHQFIRGVMKQLTGRVRDDTIFQELDHDKPICVAIMTTRSKGMRLPSA